MNGFLLYIPFLLIRFGLLAALNKNAVKRAAYFAPVRGNERWAYWVYQISNVFLFVYSCFLTVPMDRSRLFYAGMACYLPGLALCAVSIADFAKPSETGVNDSGIYRFSRNPMYLSYFLIFIGCALLTQSLLLFGSVVAFILSSHWIILSEERWCMETFGEAYERYRKKTRRYF